MDLGRFFIIDLIVHEIPKRRASDQPLGDLDLSEAAAAANDELRNFFKERITDTLTKHGHDVQFDPNQASPVPDLIMSQLDGTGGFVEMSQEAARHLYLQQNAVQPVGLLTVAIGTLEQRPAIALLKVEKQEGVRVRRDVTDEGKSTLNPEHLRELMLTERTRVFKAGVFYRDQEGIVQGRVSDEQVRDLTDFFVGRFLGCRLARRPPVVTRDFLIAAERYIDDHVQDAEAKLRYHRALQTELASHKKTVRPRDFIQEHIDTEHRQPFEAAIAKADVPLETFHKDVSRIRKAALENTQARTARGVKVSAPSETFDSVVEPRELDGEQVIVIHDRIVKVV